jgi:tetratricopeptide (TPR) repeat protein
VYQADEGDILFQGQRIHFASPVYSRRVGIETIYQDLALAGNLSVSANIFLGREAKRISRWRDESHLESYESKWSEPDAAFTRNTPLRGDWQKHVLAFSGYLELGMLDDAETALEEIAPEDKNRNEVLGARVALYAAAKKWDMAAAVASHLVKVEPENAGWWINLAYSVRRIESVEKAEAILLRAQAIHPKDSLIAFHLACYASVTARIEEAKARLRHAIALDKRVRTLAIADEDLRPLWDWISGLE